MTNADVMRYMIHHQQQIKIANDNPSKETQAAWQLQSAHTQALLKYYEQDEVDDGYEVNFSSEVKVK